MHKIELDDNVEIGGTCYVGEFYSTYDEVVEKLGKPNLGASGDGKCKCEWIGYIDNTIPFSIYDWKEYGKELKDITNWHIGGKSRKTGEIIEDLFTKGVKMSKSKGTLGQIQAIKNINRVIETTSDYGAIKDYVYKELNRITNRIARDEGYRDTLKYYAAHLKREIERLNGSKNMEE